MKIYKQRRRSGGFNRSRFPIGKVCITLVALLGSICLLSAGNVEVAAAGTTAPTRPLFSAVSVVNNTAASPEIRFELDGTAFSQVAPLSKVLLTRFPVSAEEVVDLNVEQFHVTTPGTRLVAATENGEISIPLPTISLFRGTVLGKANSKVIFAISPTGIQGIVEWPEEGYLFSPAADPPDRRVVLGLREHIILRRSDLQGQPSFKLPLSVSDVAGVATPDVPRSPMGTEGGSFRVCRLALECDYEFWMQFQDYQAALNYIYILFGAIGDMFERDVQTKLALTYIRIWTTVDDPYSYVGGEITGLNEFRDYWRANHNPGQPGFIERDVAHLLSSRGVGAWAWEGVLCNYDIGFSISGGNALLPTVAQRIFHDLRYAGHEIGHNFNGHHTHCLINPATGDWVDKCVTENDCNQTVDCSTAPSSIMSYCHNCPGGQANILAQFDSVNISRINSHVAGSCLRLTPDPCFVDWRNTSGTEDGTSAHPYNTLKEGIEAVLPGGTVSIASGNYPAGLTIWQPMTLLAPSGGVAIGP
jgi:hypothetical protein